MLRFREAHHIHLFIMYRFRHIREKHLTRIGFASLAALILAVVIGCGKDDKHNKQAVSGSVTFKGQPVKVGQLFFEPAAGQQVATNAGVEDGKFKMTKAQGLTPGKYTWKLVVFDRIAKGAEPGGADTGGPAPKNLIPPSENGKTFEVLDGKETILDIVIP
jgi:hypothetical protein